MMSFMFATNGYVLLAVATSESINWNPFATTS